MFWEILYWLVIIGIGVPILIKIGMWAYKRLAKSKDDIDRYRESRKK